MRYNSRAPGFTNSKMENDTYAMRKKAMRFIYEANKLIPSLPRINIRIGKPDKVQVLGLACVNQLSIWINEGVITSNCADHIKFVVFHEIVHAAFGLGHFYGCRLMGEFLVEDVSSVELDTLLLHYYEIAETKF